MHRVVLTGATGTLGRNFMELVGHRDDFRVLALHRRDSKLGGTWPSVKPLAVESLKKSALEVHVAGFQPNCIVHCAATGMESPRVAWRDMVDFNIDTTISLCEYAADLREQHFIFISTGLSYREQGRPLREDDPLDTLHPYGATKAAADILIRSAAAEFGVPITVLRPFSFSGLGDNRTRLFPSLLRSALQGKHMPLSAGTQIRDHCSARDIAAAIVAAIVKPCERGGSRIYNLGSGSIEPLRPMIEKLVEELNIPAKLAFGERSFGRFEPQHLVADTTQAMRELDWRPTHRFAHAVWQLAQESFPQLQLLKPEEYL